jgi:hypothetical protein
MLTYFSIPFYLKHYHTNNKLDWYFKKLLFIFNEKNYNIDLLDYIHKKNGL